MSPRGDGRGRPDFFRTGEGDGFAVFLGRDGVDVAGVLSSELRGERLLQSTLADRVLPGFEAR